MRRLSVYSNLAEVPPRYCLLAKKAEKRVKFDLRCISAAVFRFQGRLSVWQRACVCVCGLKLLFVYSSVLSL